MTIFDEIADTYEQIKEAREKLYVLELQAHTPKSGKITGMPRDDSHAGNAIELYLERKEKEEKKLKALKRRYKQQWEYAVRLMNEAGIDTETKKMMYFRFCKGLQWKRCVKELDKLYPNSKWNENKCFRNYKRVLCKIHKQIV